MSEPIVHLVDDDEAVRASLSFLLEMEGLQNRSYATAEEFLERAGSLEGGCVVTDVRMPGLSGIDLVRLLRERGESVPVIVITGHGDVPLAVEAMRVGAADFIEKPFDHEILLASIRAALSAGAAIGQAGAERRRSGEALAALSGRERDVLRGVIAGKLNKVIAYELGPARRILTNPVLAGPAGTD